MGFRVAIGECKCEEPFRDALERAACEYLRKYLNSWESRLPGDLSAVPTEAYEELVIDNRPAWFGIHKHALDEDVTLVVLQFFVSTWLRPSYLSFQRIGRLWAEGILVSADGNVSTAPDDYMWQFR